MNIGIDIDDTITCTYETLLPMIAFNYGMDLKKLFLQKPTYKMLHSILPNYENFVLQNFSTMAKIVPLKPNVVDVLTRLKDQGHRIIFITSRNNSEYGDPYKLSYNYLKMNNIPFDKLIVNVKDKAKECVMEGIDLFIDDNTKHCKAVLKSGIPTLQFANSFVSENSKVKRVNSWDEIYQKVQEMYA